MDMCEEGKPGSTGKCEQKGFQGAPNFTLFTQALSR